MKHSQRSMPKYLRFISCSSRCTCLATGGVRRAWAAAPGSAEAAPGPASAPRPWRPDGGSHRRAPPTAPSRSTFPSLPTPTLNAALTEGRKSSKTGNLLSCSRLIFFLFFIFRNAFDDGNPFQYPTVPRQNNPNKYSKPYRSAGKSWKTSAFNDRQIPTSLVTFLDDPLDKFNLSHSKSQDLFVFVMIKIKISLKRTFSSVLGG